MTDPLIDIQKKLVLKAVKINFRMDFMRRLEIDGQPADFDLFVKDISYSSGTIESAPITVDNGEVSMPQKRSVGSVTVVFRDDENGRINEFITSKQNPIYNKDGTQNLPIDYLFEIRILRIRQDGSDYLEKSWDVYVEENNEYGGADDATTETGTFSVTFQKYKSYGAID